MRIVQFLWTWLRRIPPLFSVPFLLLMLAWLVLITWALEILGADTVAQIARAILDRVGFPHFTMLTILLEGALVVLILLAGLLMSYNLAAAIYRAIRTRPSVDVGAPAALGPGSGQRLARFQRIGIILAGGGAKGAYQAGAMKAIHEFLEENDALSKVKMIAGTSIGSWNAVFWLAGLIKPAAAGARSAHEEWWRSIEASRIVEFDSYWPLAKNSFLLPTPWREVFRSLFVENPPVQRQLQPLFVPKANGGDPPIHFYLTRANVARAQLEFSTNWPGLADKKRRSFRTGEAEPVLPSDRYEVIHQGADALARFENAVFASMDLPPLFPYANIRTDMVESFEDGGVIDNVPVWFGTQFEDCDLLFVLPLNASFNERPDRQSMVKRMFRVMDIRQGVMERNSFKLAYLYNELAAARSAHSAGADALATRALSRQHRLLSVFAICPGPPLGIGTTEFWKPREAGDAFELMYAETKAELRDRFEEATRADCLRMAIVGPRGGRSYVDDF